MSIFIDTLVEVEIVALLQWRIGIDAVVAFRDLLLSQLQIIEIERDWRRAAIAGMADDGRCDISMVDRVSFDLMRRMGVERAFAFDRHFSEAGFELVAAPS